MGRPLSGRRGVALVCLNLDLSLGVSKINRRRYCFSHLNPRSQMSYSAKTRAQHTQPGAQCRCARIKKIGVTPFEIF